MPYLNIRTNVAVPSDKELPLIKRASHTTAEMLSKSEKYVMVALEAPRPLVFGGSDAPAAFLQLKSIGLPRSETANLSAALCDLMKSELGISPDRVYVEFKDAERSMWGWNGKTF